MQRLCEKWKSRSKFIPIIISQYFYENCEIAEILCESMFFLVLTEKIYGQSCAVNT